MKLIVVESPSKAKTLKGYLTSEYEVIASVGHFRDLPKSGMSIDEKNDFNVDKWEVDKEKINPVLQLIKKADEILLAPDPDREGELIAWHLLEICKEKKLLEGKEFKRIADLPTKNQLLAMLVGALSSPMTKLALTLKASMTDLGNALNNLKDRKSN